jgi:AN1-type zinc finger and ubiquitin domain-containing protein 1
MTDMELNVGLYEKNINTVNKPNFCQLDGCKTKLKLTNFKCKCNKIFCSTHTYYMDHKCDFDYKLEGNKNLEKKLIEVSGTKFEKL